jgi:hypothetical protein
MCVCLFRSLPHSLPLLLLFLLFQSTLHLLPLLLFFLLILSVLHPLLLLLLSHCSLGYPLLLNFQYKHHL